VTLRVVGGDEKGSLKCETVKYGHTNPGYATILTSYLGIDLPSDLFRRSYRNIVFIYFLAHTCHIPICSGLDSIITYEASCAAFYSPLFPRQATLLYLNILLKYPYSIETAYRLDDRSSISGRSKNFVSSPQLPCWLWGPHSLLSNTYQGSFPGLKVAGP
jgi:hypothetical protein